MTSCPNHLPFDNQKLDPVKRYHTEGERVGNQIDAAFIFAWPDFVKVRRTLRVAGACEFNHLVAWSE